MTHSNVVYKINCKDCDDIYEPDRTLKSRMNTETTSTEISHIIRSLWNIDQKILMNLIGITYASYNQMRKKIRETE